MIIPDVGIREAVWPSNGVESTVYVPFSRLGRFGPIEDRQIQPVSLDVRLAAELVLHPTGEQIEMTAAGWPMAPGECVLAALVERFDMRSDNVVAKVEGKSTWARRFLQVHAAGLIDPGFRGDVTLELKNIGHGQIFLFAGMPIAQVVFEFLAAPVQRTYGDPALGSHYQNQSGPTPAWVG